VSSVTTRNYRGVVGRIRLIFTSWGLFIVIYTLIGVFYNTASPHIPSTAASFASLHSWIQYFISVLFWPLSFWHPIFSVGKWIPTGSIIFP
jgi:hypothetical protein